MYYEGRKKEQALTTVRDSNGEVFEGEKAIPYGEGWTFFGVVQEHLYRINRLVERERE